jgi:hypothetical protein
VELAECSRKQIRQRVSSDWIGYKALSVCCGEQKYRRRVCCSEVRRSRSAAASLDLPMPGSLGKAVHMQGIETAFSAACVCAAR